MNEAQKKWLLKRIDALLNEAGDLELTESDWEKLLALGNETVIKAKNNPNVREAIILTLDYLSSMQRIMEQKNENR